MAILAIRIYPDPVLRVKCRPVETFDAGLRKLAANMVDTMHAAPGVGLAAPQVDEVPKASPVSEGWLTGKPLPVKSR